MNPRIHSIKSYSVLTSGTSLLISSAFFSSAFVSPLFPQQQALIVLNAEPTSANAEKARSGMKRTAIFTIFFAVLSASISPTFSRAKEKVLLKLSCVTTRLNTPSTQLFQRVPNGVATAGAAAAVVFATAINYLLGFCFCPARGWLIKNFKSERQLYFIS